MVEGKIALVIEASRVVEGRAVVKLVEGDNIVCMGISQCQMSHQPASTVAVRGDSCNVGAGNSHMKPAPPVIMIFLTSGSGSNFVLPFRIGASFQTPKSSKNLLDASLVEAVDLHARRDQLQFPECGTVSRQAGRQVGRKEREARTWKDSIDTVLGGHAVLCAIDKE